MRVTTRGIGAEDIDVELDRLVLFSAPCGSGKSKVADALRFAFLGMIPSLGKRAADTALLMRDAEMVAEVTLDDGRTLRRELTRVGKRLTGKVKCSWLKEKASQEEHHVAALALVGADELQAAEALDIQVLMSATPQARQARLEQMLSASSMTAEERTALVAELVARRLTDEEEKDLRDWRVLLPLIEGTDAGGPGVHGGQRAALAAAWDGMSSHLIDGIAPCLGWANEEKNSRAAKAKQKAQARKELETRVGGVDEPEEAVIADLEQQRSEIERAIGGLEERKVAVQLRNEEIDNATAKVNRAEVTLDAVRDRKRSVSESAEKREAAERRLEEIASAIEVLEAEKPVQPDLSESDALFAEARKIRAEADAIVVPQVPQTGLIERAVERLKSAIEGAKRMPWMEVRERSLAIVREMGSFSYEIPALTNIRAEADALIELAAKNGLPDTDELSTELAKAQGNLDRARREADEIKQEQQRLSEEIAAKVAQSLEIEGRAEDILRKLTEEFQQAASAYRRKLEALTRERTQLKSAIAELESRSGDVDKELAIAEAALRSARESLSALGERQECESDEDLRKSRSEIQLRIRDVQQLRARFSELRQLIAECAAAEAEHQVYRAIEWACQRARERELAQGAGALAKLVDKFLAGAGRSETWAFDPEDDCKIGWRRPGGASIISVKAISKGEWSLFAAAVTSAVILIRNSPVKLLLVEAGESDAVVLGQILRGIEAMGDLRAVVMVQRSAEAPAAWQVINPREAAEKKAA